MTFQSEKEVDDYINSLSVEHLKKIAKKQAMLHIIKEKPSVCEDGTFGHLLEKHCDSPMYCGVGFEIYSNEDKKLKFYYDFNAHKPFVEIAKVFEQYLNCKIKAVQEKENGKMFWLDSGAGSIYRVLLEI